MRILHLIHTPRHSGAEALVKSLCAVHQSWGHECGIAAFAPAQLDYHSEVEELMGSGTEIYLPDYPLEKLSRISHYQKAVSAFRPDIVFAHSVLPSLYGRWSTGFGRSRVPFISVLHSAGSVDFSDAATRLAEKITRFRIDGIITVSDEATATYSRRFGGKLKVKTIRNGIDIACYSNVSRSQAREKFNLKDGQKVALQVGRVYGVKNQVFTLSLLKPQLQEGSLTLWFAGPIEDAAYEAKLRELIKEFDVGRSVKILGGRSDIPQLLSAADLYLMPSLQEAQGIALVEALASGIPVVASSISAFQFARRMASIRLCDINDADAWRQAVAELLSAPRAKRQLDQFSISETARSYLDFHLTSKVA